MWVFFEGRGVFYFSEQIEININDGARINRTP